MSVELGSGQLIPGFEDQLVGAKAGDKRDVKVTFPADYHVADLAGKPATFAVTVKAVKTAGENKVDEEFAKSLGLQSLEQLRGLIRDQQRQELNGLTRTHMKRQLLDQLAARHDFAVPQSMVEAEHQNILGQLRHEASHEADPQAALAEIEKDAAEYRQIAERRVRLGLLLSEIGAANGVEVTEQEMNRLIAKPPRNIRARTASASCATSSRSRWSPRSCARRCTRTRSSTSCSRRPTITERKATRAELEADLESEEGHVHGPGCGHDHVAPPSRQGEEGRREGQGQGCAEAARPRSRSRRPAKGRSRRPQKPSRPSR